MAKTDGTTVPMRPSRPSAGSVNQRIQQGARDSVKKAVQQKPTGGTTGEAKVPGVNPR